MSHPQKDEIIRLANSPYKTKVWWRRDTGGKWVLTDTPTWSENNIYIVNDEWSELRKAQADGKQLQYGYMASGGWTNDTLDDEWMNISNPKQWRIKPEEPVYEYQWIFYDSVKKRYVFTDYYATYSSVGARYEPSKRIRK